MERPNARPMGIARREIILFLGCRLAFVPFISPPPLLIPPSRSVKEARRTGDVYLDCASSSLLKQRQFGITEAAMWR